MTDKNALNPARAIYYGLLGKLLIFKDSGERFAGLKKALPTLIANPIDDTSKEALERILTAFETQGDEAFVKEFDAIFYLIGGKTLKTTASYYLDGAVLGNKQLEVKNFLAKTKIRRDEKNYKEPEDSVGFLLVFMRELIEISIKGDKSYDNLQHCVFTQIINPFIDTFTNELFIHPKSVIYRDIASVLGAFMEFERLYFEAPSYPLIEIKEKPSEEDERRAKNKAKKLADKACAV